jgi:hypothetical protein
VAIAFEDSDTTSDNTGTLVLTPAGGAAASGEVVLIAVNYISGAAGSYPSAYNCSGFTTVATIDAGGSAFGALALLRKVAGGSEPSSYSVTFTGGTFYRAVGAVIVLSGVSNVTPLGTAVTNADFTTNTTWDIPALTTGSANSWDVAVVGAQGVSDPGGAAAALSSWGSSLVERADLAHDYGAIGMATALRASAGVQGATSVSIAGSGYPSGEGSLAIRVEVFEGAGGGGGSVMPLMMVHHA